jgi:hypothetical protein
VSVSAGPADRLARELAMLDREGTWESR